MKPGRGNRAERGRFVVVNVIWADFRIAGTMDVGFE